MKEGEQYKEFYEQTLQTRRDIIDKWIIIKDLVDLPTWYRKDLIDLLDNMKLDFLYRTTKLTDQVSHILYRNGWLAAIEEVKRTIEGLNIPTSESVDEVTRDIITKPWQAKSKR